MFFIYSDEIILDKIVLIFYPKNTLKLEFYMNDKKYLNAKPESPILNAIFCSIYPIAIQRMSIFFSFCDFSIHIVRGQQLFNNKLLNATR